MLFSIDTHCSASPRVRQLRLLDVVVEAKFYQLCHNANKLRTPVRQTSLNGTRIFMQTINTNLLDDVYYTRVINKHKAKRLYLLFHTRYV